MPPWLPGPGSPKFAGDYSITADERVALERWALDGAHWPNGQLRPQARSVPDREPDMELKMSAAYVQAPPPAADEYRCFVLPPTHDAQTITAFEWTLGHPGSTHHVTGFILSAAGAGKAQAREGTDGRPGFNCISFSADMEFIAELGASGVGPAGGQTLPQGVGATIPPGGAVLIQLHYAGPAAGDISGIRLWTTGELVSQLRQFALWAPVEIPCPTGVSPDPSNPCSREHAILRSTIQTPDEVRAQENYLLAQCSTELKEKLQLDYARTLPPHFSVATECIGELPSDGTLYLVHGHMHTLGMSIRVELEQDHAWNSLLDIPDWRWWWERAYAYERPVQVKAHQRVRVSCVHDNGTDIQWSAATHTPSNDGQALAPLEDPAYVVMGFERRNEMCEVFIGWVPDKTL